MRILRIISTGLKVYAIIPAFIPLHFRVPNSQNSACVFSLGTDDGHHVILKSIHDVMDCEHDYINGAIQKFDWCMKIR